VISGQTPSRNCSASASDAPLGPAQVVDGFFKPSGVKPGCLKTVLQPARSLELRTTPIGHRDLRVGVRRDDDGFISSLPARADLVGLLVERFR